jgi:hypothetical protein
MEERRAMCILHEKAVNELGEKVQRIDVALYGNGHPENGLIWKVTENTKFIQLVSKVFWPGFIISMITCVKVLDINQIISQFLKFFIG